MIVLKLMNLFNFVMKNKNLGFLILSATQVDTHLLNLLDRLIEFPDAAIAVHHDYAQAGQFPLDVVKKYNILLTNHSYKTYWSHINNVYATIDGLKLLYDQSPKIDWFITLTPSCYPIQKMDNIQYFYNICEYDALIDMHHIGYSDRFVDLDKYLIRDFTSQPWFKMPFFTKKGSFYWKTLRKKINSTNHPFINNNLPYQGSNWLSINRKVVKEIIDQNVINGDLFQFYKEHIACLPDMHPCPQETILQTFIGNLKGISIDYNNYRYINWNDSKSWSPNILDLSYWDDIVKTNAHWARKFQKGKSDALREQIDRILL